MPFLTIFRRFLITFRRFLKIVLKARQIFPDIFRTFLKVLQRLPKIAEDCRRRPKKIRRCFDHTPTNFSVVEGTKEKCYQRWYLHMWGYHIFTCEDIISFLSICYQSVDHLLLYNKIVLLMWEAQWPIVSAFVPGASGVGSSPGWGRCVVFLGKALYSHSTSLHPGV